jgi:hypothetical protein
MINHPMRTLHSITSKQIYLIISFTHSPLITNTQIALTIHQLIINQHLKQLPPILHRNRSHTILQLHLTILTIPSIPHHQTIIRIRPTPHHHLIILSPTIKSIYAKLIAILLWPFHQYLYMLSPHRMIKYQPILSSPK